MENFQNLSLLFHEQNVFTAVSVGIFFVFICGITKSLIYLAGEKASYLFDSHAISEYIAKTASPEPIRLKILFLSFPKADKTILSDYLKEPIEKPSKLFSGTVEQLKCEILSVTNYNRNIAMFFFLVSGVTILASSVASLETKFLGITVFALVLFSVNAVCNGIFAVMKYFSLKSFRTLLSKLDDFHGMHSAKFRNGLLSTQNPNSPFSKNTYQNIEYKKPSPPPAKPQLANFDVQTVTDVQTVPSEKTSSLGVIQTPKVSDLDILQKRPHQVIVATGVTNADVASIDVASTNRRPPEIENPENTQAGNATTSTTQNEPIKS
ncbi:MAG: hypothetical protein R3Y18_02675, partial [Bacillota bacterium]